MKQTFPLILFYLVISILTSTFFVKKTLGQGIDLFFKYQSYRDLFNPSHQSSINYNLVNQSVNSGNWRNAEYVSRDLTSLYHKYPDQHDLIDNLFLLSYTDSLLKEIELNNDPGHQFSFYKFMHWSELLFENGKINNQPVLEYISGFWMNTICNKLCSLSYTHPSIINDFPVFYLNKRLAVYQFYPNYKVTNIRKGLINIDQGNFKYIFSRLTFFHILLLLFFSILVIYSNINMFTKKEIV